MKFYIAGIHFNYCNHELFDHQINHMIGYSFKQISEDALAWGGEEVITLVVLPENALTHDPAPITNEKKKECLNKFQDALKIYKNMILIPGSFTTYQNLSSYSDIDQEKMKSKIKKNYEDNSKEIPYCQDNTFLSNYNKMKNKLENGSIAKSNFFQNSTYVITHSQKAKHKKSYPWCYELFCTQDTENYLFYVGSYPTVKHISLDEKTIEILPVICREYHLPPSKEVTDNPPTIEVIVSDPLREIEKEKLFAAITIIMDGRYSLSVYLNEQHPKSSLVEEIDAFCYYPLGEDYKEETGTTKSHYKNRVEITLIPPANKALLQH